MGSDLSLTRFSHNTKECCFQGTRWSPELCLALEVSRARHKRIQSPEKGTMNKAKESFKRAAVAASVVWGLVKKSERLPAVLRKQAWGRHDVDN